MKLKVIFVLFISIIIESVLVSYPFTLFTITLVSIYIEEDVTWLAFTSGILLDLFTLRLLGLDSLYFLSLIYLGSRFRKKIYGGTFVYKFIYLISAYLLYNLIFYINLNLPGVIFTSVSGLVMLLAFGKIFPSTGNKKRLAV